MPNKQKNSTNSNRYETDVTGVSMNRLEVGLWWVKNRQTFKLMLIILLIAASVIGWGYTIYGFGDYLFFGLKNDVRMMSELTANTSTKPPSSTPKNLSYSSVGFLNNGGKYDLYATVKNSNTKHWGNFSYCFTVTGGEQACGQDFILPAGQKDILILAQEFKNQPGSVTFSVSGPLWQRINRRLIPDWDKYRNDHLNISIKKSVFTPASSNEVSEKVGLNTLSFTAVNNSAFGFWEAPLIIVLKSRGQTVNVNRYVINDFVSYDNRDVNITWPGTLPPIDSISIVPDINIMNQGVFEKPND